MESVRNCRLDKWLTLLAFTTITSAVYADNRMEFVNVPGGCFEMGTDGGEKHEKPVHQVCLDSFAIGKFEVTQGQWQAVMGSNPSRFSTCGPDCPVEQVSWNDVQEFIRVLNAKNQGVYRLPTEAEWEYACRSAGKAEEYASGAGIDDLHRVAWFKDISAQQTHAVGTKEPNNLGIYDMNGNVWEWVQDTFTTPYDASLNKNPVQKGGQERVLRGGSWDGKARYVRCHIRNRNPPDRRDWRLGVRLVRER